MAVGLTALVAGLAVIAVAPIAIQLIDLLNEWRQTREHDYMEENY